MSTFAPRQTREDHRKKRELEELRRVGAAPAEIDEQGRMINPHIPEYMSSAPWYVAKEDQKPGLDHQRVHREKISGFAGLGQYYKRGKQGKSATNFRKGACSNCGALTHKTKDCCERPRAKGAKWTKKDISPDEFVPENLKFTFDGKRDRWNGYDVSQHVLVQERYKLMEEARRKKKEAQLDKELADAEETGDLDSKTKRRLERRRRRRARANREGSGSSDSDSDSDASDSDDDDLKDEGRLMQSMDSKKRSTVRNLRIREDTAKYLYNLDTDSAYYDPKTRSMRGNPFRHTGKSKSELIYAGDSFELQSGDKMHLNKAQLFAWEANKVNNESEETSLDVIADPSRVALAYKEFLDKKGSIKEKAHDSLVSKYGGAEHLHAPPPELLLGQSENYTEYSGDGRVIRGHEEAIPKSKYVEDEHENNHSSVWGSFFKDGKWGFACCHQLSKNAYCTGKAGKKAAQDVRLEMERRMASREDTEEKDRGKKRSMAPISYEANLEQELLNNPQMEALAPNEHALMWDPKLKQEEETKAKIRRRLEREQAKRLKTA